MTRRVILSSNLPRVIDQFNLLPNREKKIRSMTLGELLDNITRLVFFYCVKSNISMRVFIRQMLFTNSRTHFTMHW